MSHRLVRVATLVTVAVVCLPTHVVAATPCWNPPVVAPVTDPFRQPPCTWCSGNRGVEYGTAQGVVVRAVATGRVTFAGSVAGTVYVVVRHGDGRRVTYGNLSAESFDADDLVVRGQIIGRAAGRFHLGVREGDRYVDPERFIGALIYRPRLVPIDGTDPNPAPRPRLSCALGRD